MLVRSLAAILLISAGAFAQPAFEVASIKPSPPGQPGTHMSMDKGRVTLSNASLKYCIEAAYQLQDFQLSGGPKWLDTDRYEIEGKAPPGTTYSQMRLMMQALLADRFQLQVHRETRMEPGYALVVARNGPKLTKTQFAEDAPGPVGWGKSMVNGRNQTTGGLADTLARALERPVVDETGLKERFDFRLTWALNNDAPTPGEAPPTDGPPSLFAALQEQLGLKLEARRVPVEVVVIDRAGKPTAN